MRSFCSPLTRRLVRATSLFVGLLVGIFAGPAGAEEAGVEAAGVEAAGLEAGRLEAGRLEEGESKVKREARVGALHARGNSRSGKSLGGNSVIDRGGRAGRADFAAPALYSSSLPLGRLAALPDLPAVIVPRSNMGLDWQQWAAPLGAFQPREITDGGGVPVRGHSTATSQRTIAETGAAPESNSTTSVLRVGTAPAAGVLSSTAVAEGVGELSNGATDRFDLRRRQSGSSRERTVLREWETPAPKPAPSSMLIGLDDAHSQLLHSLRPERAPAGEAHRDVFRVRPEPVDPREKALRALGEKMLYRELRRYFRRELKDQFKEDPSLGIDTYLDRRGLIGQLGRGGRAEDLVIEERVTELRNEFLDASEENFERDIPILQWGPLVLDDRGGVNIDVVDLKKRDPESYALEFAPEARRVGGYGESVLFPDERYRVSSNLKFNPDLREVGRDWNEAFGKLTASVEIDWRAPVLEDRAFSAELGGSIRGDGRYGLYLNFVIYGK